MGVVEFRYVVPRLSVVSDGDFCTREVAFDQGVKEGLRAAATSIVSTRPRDWLFAWRCRLAQPTWLLVGGWVNKKIDYPLCGIIDEDGGRHVDGSIVVRFRHWSPNPSKERRCSPCMGRIQFMCVAK
jgi:hypothetical protein